jgi:hypothetical protein
MAVISKYAFRSLKAPISRGMRDLTILREYLALRGWQGKLSNPSKCHNFDRADLWAAILPSWTRLITALSQCPTPPCYQRRYCRMLQKSTSRLVGYFHLIEIGYFQKKQRTPAWNLQSGHSANLVRLCFDQIHLHVVVVVVC